MVGQARLAVSLRLWFWHPSCLILLADIGLTISHISHFLLPFIMSRLLHSSVLRSFRHFMLALMLLAIAGLFITSHTRGDGNGVVSNTSPPASYFDASLYTPEQLSLSSINDGIPDVWKDYYGFSLSDPELAQADYNGSGATNLVKYLANLWPLDTTPPAPLLSAKPKAPPAVASKTAAATAPAFSFDGSFSIPSSLKLKNGSGGYKNGAFQWSYVDGLVGKWQAYAGSKIEAWKV